MDNVRVSNFGRALLAENSTIQARNVFLNNNRIGMELMNSPAVIQQSHVSGNQIDILADTAPVEIIDSIVSRIIINGIEELIHSQPVNIFIDSHKLKAQAQEILKPQNPILKRQRFKQLIKDLYKAAGAATTIVAIIEAIRNYGSSFFG